MKIKNIFLFSLAVMILAGIVLLALSFALDPYTDNEAYMEKYAALTSGDSELFYELRAQYLTPKYCYEDYGLTLILLGVMLIPIFLRPFSVPDKKWKIVLFGFIAFIATFITTIADFYHEFLRGEYPVWADSLGIPLAATMSGSVFVMGWLLINFLALTGKFSPGVVVTKISLRNANLFYPLLSAFLLVYLLYCVVYGFFWSILPTGLWIYFYAFLFFGRHASCVQTETPPLSQSVVDSKCPFEKQKDTYLFKKRKLILFILVAVMILTGIVLLALSFTLDPYTDYEAYMAKYAVLTNGDDALFDELRAQYLTPKYRYEDYGLTLILLGVMLIPIFLRPFSVPDKKWKIVLFGFIAFIAFFITSIAHNFCKFLRGEYPHWSDFWVNSIFGSMVLSLLLMGWLLINFLALTGKFCPGVVVTKISLRNANLFYPLLSAFLLVYLLHCVVCGCFWFILPTVLWIYFYAFLFFGRHASCVQTETPPLSQ